MRQAQEEIKQEDSDSSDGLSCLVANESIRVSTYSPRGIGKGLRSLRKHASFMGSYKRRIIQCEPGKEPVLSGKKEHLVMDTKTGLTSNNSPIQNEMAINQALRTQRTGTVKFSTSQVKLEKENTKITVKQPSTARQQREAQAENENVEFMKEEEVLNLITQNSQNNVVNRKRSLAKASLVGDEVQLSSLHARNYSVNLPYSTKPVLHTNMNKVNQACQRDSQRSYYQQNPVAPALTSRNLVKRQSHQTLSI